MTEIEAIVDSREAEQCRIITGRRATTTRCNKNVNVNPKEQRSSICNIVLGKEKVYYYPLRELFQLSLALFSICDNSRRGL